MTVLATVLLSLSLPSLAAGRWPELTEAEKALRSVPGLPNTPAVVLLSQGNVFFSPDWKSSYIEVFTRIKILTEEGKDYGSVSLFSSDYLRVKDLEGRTLLPDGRVLELPRDATFTKRYSTYFRRETVSFAMPGVGVGAIVEYSYRRYFDSIFYPVPWYFQAEIPTVRSCVTFDLPNTIRFAPDVVRTINRELRQEPTNYVRGTLVTYTMENVPAVPDEPERFPFADLATRVSMLPQYDLSGQRLAVLETWDSVARLASGNPKYGYEHVRTDAAATKRKGRELAAGQATPRERAAAVYRWVRDEVDTEPFGGIWVGEVHADDLLRERKADATEKALLLQLMLEGAKVDALLGWTNPRDEGRIRQAVVNPSQLGTVLVVLELDGQRVFLDPSDRTLGFGVLPATLQGVPCLLLRGNKPEWVVTPQRSAEESMRDAALSLRLGEDGVLAGTGSLRLTGNHALRRLRLEETREKTLDAWTTWLEKQLPGFAVSELALEEDTEGDRLSLAWRMTQRPEAVTDGEAAVKVAAPLAVATNPFTLEPERRLSPVQLAFPDTDRLHLELSWPAGWALEARPELREISNDVARLATSFATDPAAHTATLERSFAILRSELVGREAYAALRAAYQAAVANDAESIVLARE